MKYRLVSLITTAALALSLPVAALAATCVKTSISYSSSSADQVCATGGNNLITSFLLDIVRFLGGLVGLIVVLMIIIGGVQYIASGGDPKGIAAAKSRIFNAVLALILYILMFGILAYLIPGIFIV